MPSEVEVTFGDGRRERFPWAAEEPAFERTFEEAACVRQATIDPDRRVLVDLRRANDTRVRDEARAPFFSEAARVLRQGFAATNTGLLEGMAGVGVPVFDAAGRVVAALSIGTLTARLAGDRLAVVVSLLQREASALSAQINPLDRALRRPAEALGAVPRSSA